MGDDRYSVKGKNAVLSGAAGGIGVEVIEALLKHGLDGIVLLDFDGKKLEAVRDQFRKQFPDRTVESKVVDVTKVKEIQESLDFAVQKLPSIDIILPFAGILPTEESIENWDKIMAVNASGAYYMAKVYGDYMVDQEKGGSIVFVASIAGHTPSYPLPAAYGASKAAILSLRGNMSRMYGPHDIRVNSISPGFWETSMTDFTRETPLEDVFNERNPLHRYGQKGELSGAVMLLASDAGSYINASDIMIDGGFVAKL
ncbi:hypothetical protein TRICI_004662 [Trichomonascus ciferrii]|uniref:Uncharacterized protein n=1 Tax=Trichomonascus ciferrii TaxID=44093 RepID=A0A642V0D9_9ASCO|nr:hypothetical protein TRICI_004662 [Trichomonascus ciferrii]